MDHQNGSSKAAKFVDQCCIAITYCNFLRLVTKESCKIYQSVNKEIIAKFFNRLSEKIKNSLISSEKTTRFLTIGCKKKKLQMGRKKKYCEEHQSNSTVDRSPGKLRNSLISNRKTHDVLQSVAFLSVQGNMRNSQIGRG